MDLQGRPIYEADMDDDLADRLQTAEPAFEPKPTGWQTFGSIKAVAKEENGFIGVADGRREAAAVGC